MRTDKQRGALLRCVEPTNEVSGIVDAVTQSRGGHPVANTLVDAVHRFAKKPSGDPARLFGVLPQDLAPLKDGVGPGDCGGTRHAATRLLGWRHAAVTSGIDWVWAHTLWCREGGIEHIQRRSRGQSVRRKNVRPTAFNPNRPPGRNFAAVRDHLVFHINGQRHEVRGAAAASTLSDYLRNGSESAGRAPLTGTKIACAEGDCGACTVLVGRPEGERLRYETIDACIAFTYQMDRRHVVTVEGLAIDGHTQVQRAMTDCHGSQCGFCTPGFVVALHGLVERRTGDAGGDRLSEDDLRLGLSGNLCRCTGYEQILEAGRGLDIGGAAGIDELYRPKPILADFASLGDEPVHVNATGGYGSNGSSSHPPEVFLPQTLDQLVRRRADSPGAKLVAGATDIGVQHNHGRINPNDILATSGVREFDRLEVEGGDLVIGAAVTWDRIEEFVAHRVPEYHRILTRFGSPQVRHAGTLAGNLANASPIADSIPFHYVAGSTLELASIGGRRVAPIESFYLGYKQLDLRPEEVIATIRTPLPTDSTRLKLYKVSKRRDMDISTVTAAFWFELSDDTVAAARIALGGVGPTVVRAPRAEQAIVGERFTPEAMRSAGRAARGEITPITDVRGGSDYRGQLVENLFMKCWHDLATQDSSQQPAPV